MRGMRRKEKATMCDHSEISGILEAFFAPRACGYCKFYTKEHNGGATVRGGTPVPCCVGCQHHEFYSRHKCHWKVLYEIDFDGKGVGDAR